MTNFSFGKALGALILQKRRTQGLSQMQLSEDAFGTPAKTRRISELENGQVDNPHPTTIDPIIVALGITDSEVEECARATNRQVDPDLDRAYREARNLIDALAYQFDHARPDASLSDLEDFLRSKAKEWRQLIARVELIDASSDELEGLKTEVNAALAEGQFEKVDVLLARIEEGFQLQRTLAEISKQAQIRVTRGDTSLMQENPDQALDHYLRAANFFEHFDEEGMIGILYDNAHKMYESGLRTLRPRFQIGIRLLEEMLGLETIKSNSIRESRTHYQLGLILRNAAGQKSGDERRNLVQRAIDHSRKAASQTVTAGDAFQVVSSMNALANCLLDKGVYDGDLDALNEALTTNRSARLITLEEEGAAPLLAHASSGIGAIILAIERLTNDTLSDARIEEVIGHFDEAIDSAAKHFCIDIWGAAQINRARLFERRARQADRPEHERAFLRIRAIADYQASIETYPETVFPLRYAQTHFELANIMFQQGLNPDHPQAEHYLFRAIQSYEIAGIVFQQEKLTLSWADCQMYIGSVFAHHADFDGGRTRQHDLPKAMEYFEAALEVFRKEDSKYGRERCEQALARLKSNMAEGPDD
ncbi:helix-turn-helix domain-containing protein [Sphingobium sp. BYY-5]|uniref:helix-turn-helix domain-containing protein n=1 Tax=Sphingobium sp. BYY-5 TaxID=2926400 RepID=UPI001FA729CF|nr:helix-turn-helix transcriptional regulator [Sphingobium sp. BYY-5]MCI4592504.1 helix-turn-helix domain-containing protein [Sphingobium sp. BYY-5]